MPRYPRMDSPTGAYHFINRGVNKKKIFHRMEDFEVFKELLMEYKTKLGVDIFHYCLMSNHTHILLRAESAAILSKYAHFVQRRYAYYYCKTYHWAEQVFRKRYISLPIDRDAHLTECGRYIERNPLEAHLVSDPIHYPFSSYAFYAYNKPDDILTVSPAYEAMGNTPDERMSAYRFYIIQPRDYEIPNTIKKELTPV